MESHQCGFLSLIYFFHIVSAQEFRAFQHDYNNTCITEKSWYNKKKKQREDIMNRTRYVENGVGGQANAFRNYFNIAAFKLLSREERSGHTLKECKLCLRQPHRDYLKLKRSNTAGIKANPTTATENLIHLVETTQVNANNCAAFAKSVLQASDEVLSTVTPNSKTVDLIPLKKTCDPKNVKQSCKRKIIAEANKEIKGMLKQRCFEATFSSSLSEQSLDTFNRDMYAINDCIPGKQRSHTAVLESYEYDRAALILRLQDVEDFFTLNYSPLAREVNLRRNGEEPGNRGQVGGVFVAGCTSTGS